MLIFYAGATVITTARKTPDELKDSNGTTEIVSKILERFDGVDILINNVGGSSTPTGGVLKQTDADDSVTFLWTFHDDAVVLDAGKESKSFSDLNPIISERNSIFTLLYSV